MPYIDKETKEELAIPGMPPILPGELNYMVVQLCLEYLDVHGIKYTTFNDIIGALECAKLEIYRRLVGPYENIKIATNGDVIPNQVIAEVSSYGTSAPGCSVQDRP